MVTVPVTTNQIFMAFMDFHGPSVLAGFEPGCSKLPTSQRRVPYLLRCKVVHPRF